MVRILRPLVAEIGKLTSQIEHAVAQLQAGRVLMSFPRAGKINAAQILAEIGEDPVRFPSEEQLAARMQQTAAQSSDLLRRQLPPELDLGTRHLRSGKSSRL